MALIPKTGFGIEAAWQRPKRGILDSARRFRNWFASDVKRSVASRYSASV
jgi:hypothetical protein